MTDYLLIIDRRIPEFEKIVENKDSESIKRVQIVDLLLSNIELRNYYLALHVDNIIKAINCRIIWPEAYAFNIDQATYSSLEFIYKKDAILKTSAYITTGKQLADSFDNHPLANKNSNIPPGYDEDNLF